LQRVGQLFNIFSSQTNVCFQVINNCDVTHRMIKTDLSEKSDKITFLYISSHSTFPHFDFPHVLRPQDTFLCKIPHDRINTVGKRGKVNSFKKAVVVSTSMVRIKQTPAKNVDVSSPSDSESDSESGYYSETPEESEESSGEEEEEVIEEEEEEESETEGESELEVEGENTRYSLPAKKRGQPKTSVSVVGKKVEDELDYSPPIKKRKVNELDYSLPPKKRRQSKASAETVGKKAVATREKQSVATREKQSVATREKQSVATREKKLVATPEKKAVATREKKAAEMVEKKSVKQKTSEKKVQKKRPSPKDEKEGEGETEKLEYILEEDKKSKVKDVSNSTTAYDRSKFLLDPRHFMQVTGCQIKGRGTHFDNFVVGREPEAGKLGKDGKPQKVFRMTLPIRCTEPGYKALCKITGRTVMDKNGNPMKED
jgi:hypothetical protein